MILMGTAREENEMSRYIDADNLHNAKFQNTDGYGENVAYRLGWNEAIEAIEENEPTAIDIVRCKECKHWHKWSDWEMFCGHFDGGIGSDADDFCSYGVRETNTTAEEKPTPIRDYMVHGEREGE